MNGDVNVNSSDNSIDTFTFTGGDMNGGQQRQLFTWRRLFLHSPLWFCYGGIPLEVWSGVKWRYGGVGLWE